MAREFIAPGNIFTGAGALDMAEDKLRQLGKEALIVTDNVMIVNCVASDPVPAVVGIATVVGSSPPMIFPI